MKKRKETNFASSVRSFEKYQKYNSEPSMDELIANGGKKMKKKETKWRKETREGKIDSSSSDQHPT